MKSRFFCSCFVLLACAGVALGEGAYQRTQDDKTIVWNNAPKQGDTAKWNGDRDADGYATGFGTLTWYTADTEIFANYYGNMVRGKLDGPVNVHSRGKTAHAIFVDGKRSTRWTMGRSPSVYAIAKRLAAVRERVAKAEKSEEKENPPKDESAVADAQPASAVDGLRRGERPMEEAAVESAVPTKSEVAPETMAKAKQENAQRSTSNAQHPMEEAPVESSARTKSEVPPKLIAKTEGENVQRPMEETPAEGPAKTEKEKENPPKGGSVATSVKPRTGEKPASGLVGYKEAKDEKTAAAKAASTPAEKKSAVDDSVRLVMQPPSSLRQPSDEAAGSDSQAQLTKEEVIGAADTAARAAGYDLKEYERPKAEYNSAAGTWSLVYDRKPIGGNAETGEPFSVAVDDRTKKASIVTGL